MLKKLATLAGAVGARGSGPWAVIRGRPLDPGWPGCWATASRLKPEGSTAQGDGSDAPWWLRRAPPVGGRIQAG